VLRKPVSSSSSSSSNSRRNTSAFSSQVTPGDPLGLCYHEVLRLATPIYSDIFCFSLPYKGVSKRRETGSID